MTYVIKESDMDNMLISLKERLNKFIEDNGLDDSFGNGFIYVAVDDEKLVGHHKLELSTGDVTIVFFVNDAQGIEQFDIRDKKNTVGIIDVDRKRDMNLLGIMDERSAIQELFHKRIMETMPVFDDYEIDYSTRKAWQTPYGPQNRKRKGNR